MNSRDGPGIPRREFLKAAACISSVLLPSPRASAAVSSPSKPNILYLMTDQHRGDCLGCAGNRIIKTPNLDALAADGVLFTNAYSSTPSCTPARSAILTGRAPWHHGMLGDHYLWRKTYAYDGREQLFDLDKDPGECHDLAGESTSQDTLKLWRQRMAAHLSERGREFVDNGALTIRKKRLLYSPNHRKDGTCLLSESVGAASWLRQHPHWRSPTSRGVSGARTIVSMWRGLVLAARGPGK